MAWVHTADDLRFMHEAIALAERAQSAGEVPVGAVVVHQGQIIGRGWNCTIGPHDPTAHPTVVALGEPAPRLGHYPRGGRQESVDAPTVPHGSGPPV